MNNQNQISKKYKLILAASLGANFVLLGLLILGPLVFQHFLPRPSKPLQMMEFLVKRLPEADGLILRQTLETHGSKLKSLQNQMEQHLGQMKVIVQTEPINQAEFAAKSQEIHQTHTEVAQTIWRVMTEAIPKFSKEGRQAIANLPK